MSYFILGINVMLMVLVWPVNRWVMKNGGRTRSIGLAITFVGMILSACGAVLSGQPFFSATAILYGFITGVAYDFGFCMIIFYCLKIGPAGATAIINNLGFMFPVLIGLVAFSGGKSPSLFAVLGIASAILSLALMAFNKTEGESKAASSKWFKWVTLGALLSGISLSSQYIATQLTPENPYTFAFNANLFAFAVLVVVSLVMKDTRPKKSEMIAGGITGAINIVSTVMLFYLLQNIPAFVIYPVIMTAPVLIMLVVGHYVYKEKMNRFGWAACIIGMIGLVLFNI